MSRSRRSRGVPITPYLAAFAFVAAATIGLIVLQSELPALFNLPLAVLAFLLAINLATQSLGFGAGVAAAIGSFLCLNFFFIEPRGTFLVHDTTDLVLLAIFLVVALVNNQLLGRSQRRAVEAAQREQDAIRFYELSLTLISTNSATDIATLLADRLRGILNAQAVDVTLQAASSEPTSRAVAPQRALPDQPADYTEPIASARASFGQVRIWRAGPPLSLGEERLVRTFVGEAALILERMRMSNVDTRARVLEESDRLKTALLGSVSHELRTPLATIRAGVESLRSGLVAPDSDAGHEMLDDVSEASERLNKLVSNMLDMSRIESGALKPQREWADLVEIVNGAVARLRNDLSQHPLALALSASLPLIPADPVQLDQVFTNLITNSIKYAPAGTPVCIAAHVQADEMLLTQVSNESPRLPAEDLERIFDKFYRVTNADRVLGTGLGLSICKGIIEAHGGRIWAANREGANQGVTFNFTLPLTWDGASPKLPPRETAPSDP